MIFEKFLKKFFQHRLLFWCRLLLGFRKFSTVDYYSVATFIRDHRVIVPLRKIPTCRLEELNLDQSLQNFGFCLFHHFPSTKKSREQTINFKNFMGRLEHPTVQVGPPLDTQTPIRDSNTYTSLCSLNNN